MQHRPGSSSPCLCKGRACPVRRTVHDSSSAAAQMRQASATGRRHQGRNGGEEGSEVARGAISGGGGRCCFCLRRSRPAHVLITGGASKELAEEGLRPLLTPRRCGS